MQTVAGCPMGLRAAGRLHNPVTSGGGAVASALRIGGNGPGGLPLGVPGGALGRAGGARASALRVDGMGLAAVMAGGHAADGQPLAGGRRAGRNCGAVDASACLAGGGGEMWGLGARGYSRSPRERYPWGMQAVSDTAAGVPAEDDAAATGVSDSDIYDAVSSDPETKASAADDPAEAPKGGYSLIKTNRVVKTSWEKIIRWGNMKGAREKERDALSLTKKIVVFGGGSFGTAMGALLARNHEDLEVIMLVRNLDTVRSINTMHINDRYLPNHTLPTNVVATADAEEAILGAQFILHAVPVQATRQFLSSVRHLIPDDVPILSVSKGLEVGTGEMMSELIPSALERDQPLAVLSGPTFALEMMDLQPTCITCASENPHLAMTVQRLFACPYLRVNTSNDVIGVEIAGSLKNVLAIAAGIVEGLELGNNAMAALTATGVSEIRWLAEKMGAKPQTLSGVAGVGDIMLTCFVNLSRNRTVGVRLGQGEKIEDILASNTQVAEGVATAGVVVELAHKYQVSLPILTAVARILENKLTPRKAVFQLMNLPQIEEV